MFESIGPSSAERRLTRCCSSMLTRRACAARSCSCAQQLRGCRVHGVMVPCGASPWQPAAPLPPPADALPQPPVDPLPQAQRHSSGSNQLSAVLLLLATFRNRCHIDVMQLALQAASTVHSLKDLGTAGRLQRTRHRAVRTSGRACPAHSAAKARAGSAERPWCYQAARANETQDEGLPPPTRKSVMPMDSRMVSHVSDVCGTLSEYSYTIP